jgi:hypothetical protein
MVPPEYRPKLIILSHFVPLLRSSETRSSVLDNHMTVYMHGRPVVREFFAEEDNIQVSSYQVIRIQKM